MSFNLKRSCTLLILGVLFASTTGCISSAAQSPTVPSVPEPKIFRQSVQLVPSVSASVTKVQFFESGRSDIELRKKRVYQRRFAQAETRTVYTEIHLEHPQVPKRIDFAVTLVVSHANGTIFRIEDYKGRIQPDWAASDHWIGVGHHSPGDWDAGAYKVDIFINGDRVATSSFEIYP